MARLRGEAGDNHRPLGVHLRASAATTPPARRTHFTLPPRSAAAPSPPSAATPASAAAADPASAASSKRFSRIPVPRNRLADSLPSAEADKANAAAATCSSTANAAEKTVAPRDSKLSFTTDDSLTIADTDQAQISSFPPRNDSLKTRIPSPVPNFSLPGRNSHVPSISTIASSVMTAQLQTASPVPIGHSRRPELINVAIAQSSNERATPSRSFGRQDLLTPDAAADLDEGRRGRLQRKTTSPNLRGPTLSSADQSTSRVHRPAHFINRLATIESQPVLPALSQPPLADDSDDESFQSDEFDRSYNIITASPTPAQAFVSTGNVPRPLNQHDQTLSRLLGHDTAPQNGEEPKGLASMFDINENTSANPTDSTISNKAATADRYLEQSIHDSPPAYTRPLAAHGPTGAHVGDSEEANASTKSATVSDLYHPQSSGPLEQFPAFEDSAFPVMSFSPNAPYDPHAACPSDIHDSPSRKGTPEVSINSRKPFGVKATRQPAQKQSSSNFSASANAASAGSQIPKPTRFLHGRHSGRDLNKTAGAQEGKRSRSRSRMVMDKVAGVFNRKPPQSPPPSLPVQRPTNKRAEPRDEQKLLKPSTRPTNNNIVRRFQKSVPPPKSPPKKILALADSQKIQLDRRMTTEELQEAIDSKISDTQDAETRLNLMTMKQVLNDCVQSSKEGILAAEKAKQASMMAEGARMKMMAGYNILQKMAYRMLEP